MKFNQSNAKLAVLYLFFLAIFCASCTNHSINLISPIDGIVIQNNMPTLTWEKDTCTSYEIWIDDIKMDEVAGNINSYYPIALSFGEHEWFVIGHSGEKSLYSVKGKFHITDRPLEKLPSTAILLRNNWKVQSSLLVNDKGDELTLHTINTKNWYPTSIPSTVLTTLVRNGIYPNPNISLNNLMIPDANDEFNQENNLLKYSHIEEENPWKQKYWYRRAFGVHKSYLQEQVWLNIDEINYRAEIWLNGELVADSSQLVGMERNFRLPITKYLNGKGPNIIAIAIYPPNHVGKPSPPPIVPLAHPGRNLGEDALITKDYTKWDVLGWDWQPAVRDRDMGITGDIYLTVSNDIEITNLYVSSDLPLPDTTQANLTISADISNYSDETKEGFISGQIICEDQIINIEQPFTVSPHKSISVLWNNNSDEQLKIENPHLWWPNGYGKPSLYNLILTATCLSGETAIDSSKFGIREIETYIGNNEREYKINGEKIYIKGGNWVDDLLLNWTASRFKNELKLTKAAGLNLLRVWGPTGVPPTVFYDLADSLGLLIWQDFLNDYWGTFKNDPEYTPTIKQFKASTIDIIKKLRNHPSVIIWCGGNEGPNPKEQLITQELLPQYDGRDTKHYLKISNGDGLHGGGPYHTIDPKSYFTNPKLQGFSSELGPSGVPVVESMAKFMRNIGKNWKPDQFPLNSEWTYHDATDRYQSDERKFTHYDDLVRNFYGAPDSTTSVGFTDYLKKCQLVNYDAYRSCIEAINDQLWENASGYALWKSNSSWPSVVWQLYDWYLQPQSGYYAAQRANEPIHIQLNRATMEVSILNSSLHDAENVKVSGTLYNSELDEIWGKTEVKILPKNALTKTNWKVPENNELNFLILKIEDKTGNELSRNFYWLNKTYDFKALNSLPETELNPSVQQIDSIGTLTYNVGITNNGAGLAFMIRLKLEGQQSGNELLPSFWDNNYFSLLPGETIVTRVSIESTDLTEIPMIGVQAFNQNTPLRVQITK